MDLVYLIHENNISLIFSLLKISFINWVDSCFSSGPYSLGVFYWPLTASLRAFSRSFHRGFLQVYFIGPQ
jgi:hypothetical protein